MRQMPHVLRSILSTIVALSMLPLCASTSLVARAETPLPPQIPLGETEAFGRLLTYAGRQGISVYNQRTEGNVTGHTDYRDVWVSTDLTPEMRVCVLAHELAHVLIHADEANADFVGFSLCSSLGYLDHKNTDLTIKQQSYTLLGVLSTLH